MTTPPARSSSCSPSCSRLDRGYRPRRKIPGVERCRLIIWTFTLAAVLGLTIGVHRHDQPGQAPNVDCAVCKIAQQMPILFAGGAAPLRLAAVPESAIAEPRAHVSVSVTPRSSGRAPPEILL